MDNINEKDLSIDTQLLSEISMLASNSKSNACNFFLNSICSGVVLNIIFYKIGSKNFISKSSHQEELKIVSEYFYYRAFYNYLFSLLESFLSAFLIECISNENVNNRDQLNDYLKDKYKYKYISYQNLKYVSSYYFKELNIPIREYKQYNILEMKMEQRHINTHNLGFVDKKFLSGQWSFLNFLSEHYEEPVIATKIDERELYSIIALIIDFSCYIDKFKDTQ